MQEILPHQQQLQSYIISSKLKSFFGLERLPTNLPQKLRRSAAVLKTLRSWSVHPQSGMNAEMVQGLGFKV